MRSPPATTASLDSGLTAEGITLNDTQSTSSSTSTYTAVADSTMREPPPSLATSTSSSTSFSNTVHKRNRRSSSHGAYVSRVSFDDTNSNGGGGGTGFDQSYTLRATTSGFIRTRESRTFLVATDLNAYSMHALNWCVDSLIEGEQLQLPNRYNLSGS